MRTLFWAVTPLLALCLSAQEAPEIGSRRELFVDRYLIGAMNNTELRMHPPVERGIAVRFDRPWEGAFSAYATVIHDADLYRLYYRGIPAAGEDGRAGEVTCYAESRDGIRWTKPDLGLFEVNGTRANNVILAGQPPFSHNFTPFLDRKPGVPNTERFKALAGLARSGLSAFISADGIHWKRMRAEPIFPATTEPMFDSQNLAFWSASEGLYVCYFRSFKQIGSHRVRWVSRATSRDFLHWSDPEEMSFGDAPPEHIYVNQTSPYFRAPHIYISIAARFWPGREVLSAAQAKAAGIEAGYFRDASDAVLFSSRGGDRYVRTFLESYIRPGLGAANWSSRTNYPALNVVQTGPTEMSVYLTRDYAQPKCHLSRYALRLDGFVSVHAPYAGGELLTRPFRFRGRSLEINYSTSAAGGLRVEIQDQSGNPINGFSLAECPEIIGDEIGRVVRWSAGSDVGGLQGRTVRLRFVMKDADLYAIRFRPGVRE